MTKKDGSQRKPISLAPLTVDEALEALLKTPPPKGEPDDETKTPKRPRKPKALG